MDVRPRKLYTPSDVCELHRGHARTSSQPQHQPTEQCMSKAHVGRATKYKLSTVHILFPLNKSIDDSGVPSIRKPGQTGIARGHSK